MNFFNYLDKLGTVPIRPEIQYHRVSTLELGNGLLPVRLLL
jgi:hypothetical protein